MKWHTIISEYCPPERFVDVQVKGPYAMWRHLHTFEPVSEGTLMRDFVTYRVPFSFLGGIFHRVIFKNNFRIFSHIVLFGLMNGLKESSIVN